jgi:cysteine-rich repeat protein
MQTQAIEKFNNSMKKNQIIFGIIITLGVLLFASESRVLRGSLSPSFISKEGIVRQFIDGDHNEIVTAREMRQALRKVIHGVASQDMTMNFTGDTIVDREDLQLFIRIVRYLLTCGDGVMQTKEQCDDQNTRTGDGCDNVCHQESEYACTGAPSLCVAALQVLSCTSPEERSLTFTKEQTSYQRQSLDGFTGTKSILFTVFSHTTEERLENGRRVMIAGRVAQDSAITGGLGYYTEQAIIDSYGETLLNVNREEHPYSVVLANLVGSAQKDLIIPLWSSAFLGTKVIAIDRETGVRTTLFSIQDRPEKAGIAVSDLDADGDTDVVMTISGSQKNETVWMEQKDGTWVKHSISSDGGLFVSIQNVSGNAYKDILITRADQSSVLLVQSQSCTIPVAAPLPIITSVRISNASSVNVDRNAYLGQRSLLEIISNQALSTMLSGANFAYAIEYSLDHGATWQHYEYITFGGIAFPNNTIRTANIWVVGQQGEKVGDTIQFKVLVIDQSTVPTVFTSRTEKNPSIQLLPISALSNELPILPQCGDGIIESGEACDNDIGNILPTTPSDKGGQIPPRKNDGCSDVCTIEEGYTCTARVGMQSVCTAQ